MARITLTIDNAAKRMVLDRSFQSDWKVLHQECEWSTAFQSVEFVTTWFECYEPDYLPLIVTDRSGDKRLNGLMILAVSSGLVCAPAGTHQAEYQVWLQNANCDPSFLEGAVRKLFSSVRIPKLTFKYVPAAFPMEMVTTNSFLSKHSLIRPRRRPLWDFKQSSPELSFQKKRNRQQLNRLHRIGETTFERVRSTYQFRDVLRSVAPYYDFRQGALNGSMPFTEDTRKLPFHVALFSASSEILHGTVLRVNGEAVSLIVGLVSKGELHLAIIAHSPFFARYSVGKLHLLLLCEELDRTGMQLLDLTPGDDPWKDLHATSYDKVYELTIFRSGILCAATAMLVAARKFVKRPLQRAGLTSYRLRQFTSRPPRAIGQRMMSHAIRAAYEKLEFRIYRQAIARGNESVAERSNASIVYKVNSVPDLLCYEEFESWQRKSTFLHDALKRLEKGHRVYTIVESRRLVHYGWMSLDENASFFTEVAARYTYSDPGVVLYDFYTHPLARRRGLYQSTLLRMLSDCPGAAGARYAYISCLASNAPSRYVIEKLGFSHVVSIWRRRYLGKVTYVTTTYCENTHNFGSPDVGSDAQ